MSEGALPTRAAHAARLSGSDRRVSGHGVAGRARGGWAAPRASLSLRGRRKARSSGATPAQPCVLAVGTGAGAHPPPALKGARRGVASAAHLEGDLKQDALAS